MSTIMIASIELKPKRSIVTTTEGRKLGCWTDKIGKLGLEQGGTYNVETEDSDFNGKTLTNIVSAKRVTLGTNAAKITAGAYRQSEVSSAPSASAAFRTPEQISVTEILCAYIANGRCEPEKLTETMRYIRNAWNQNFGSDDRIFPASEAGRHAA